MYLIKKIVYWLVNPLSLGLIGIGAGLTTALCHYVVLGLGLIALSLAWLWLWSLPALYKIIGSWLERRWKVGGLEDWKVGDFDYIIELGGGVSCDLIACPTAEGVAACERALYAARLWKAEFAPKVVVTGVYTSAIDKDILMQCGVPADAIIEERTARNTVENAKGVMNVIGGLEGWKVGDPLLHSPTPPTLRRALARLMRRTRLRTRPGRSRTW